MYVQSFILKAIYHNVVCSSEKLETTCMYKYGGGLIG